MKIVATQYSLKDKSLDIFISGCNAPHCPNCHNPELWDFDLGEEYSTKYFFEKISTKIAEFDELIDKVRVMGGEPLDQRGPQLHDLLANLVIHGYCRPLWLFTRYPFERVPKQVSGICNYVKCGEYREDLKTEDNICYGVKLASSNQIIYKRGVDY